MITNKQDCIDSQDVIERIQQLSVIRQPGPVDDGLDDDGLDDEDSDRTNDELLAELGSLEKLAKDASDYVDDWEYGVTMVSETYFTEYAKELAEDIGAVNANASWPLSYIDWEGAADALKADYTGLDFNGVTYYVR